MKYLIPLLIYLNLSIYAQIKEHFSEPHLQAWSGDTGKFVVENQALKTNGSNSANQTISIARPSAFYSNTEWYLSVDLKFNPTANNFVRIYLCSDQMELDKSLNGYFIQFGESNADTLDFYRQEGTKVSKLFTGKTSFVNNLKCDLKVVKTGNQNWAFYTRSGTNNYTLEGSVSDAVVAHTQYFGILCQYATASRFDQFYFDNLEIKKTEKDTVPPSLIKSIYRDEHSFLLLFSEALKNLKIESPDFTVSDYTYENADSSSIRISTTKSLPLGKAVAFQIVSATDRHGNLASYQKQEVVCARKPTLHDLVFTELMVDESPSQGLPEHEYLEVFNRSLDFINIKNCYLSDGSKKYAFPDSILKPRQYYLICKLSDTVDFYFVKNKIPFTTLPVLNNSGKSLKIVHDSTLICEVTYTDQWYKDASKTEGGWSLELLDLDNFCEEYYNWKSSVSTLGGTPGISNSVQSMVSDSTPFDLLDIEIQKDSIICLKFNKRLSVANTYSKCLKLLHSHIKSIDDKLSAQGIINLSVAKLDSALSSLHLQIQNLQSCYGKTMWLDTTFLLPKKVLPSQLLINEVLFDAVSGGAEYIELYNALNHPLNLKNLYLSKRRNDSLYTSKIISSKDLWLNGQELMVLTDERQYIIDNYSQAIESKIHPLKSWPQFPDDSGTVILHNPEGEIIDFFHYHAKLHNPLIQITQGVALEKTMASAPSNNAPMWKSASEVSGFGSPTQPNSQLAHVSAHFNIHPLVISPNGDGRDDYCTIRPKQQENTDLVNIRVIDGEGRLVKTIAQNSNLGNNTFFTWDGTLDNQTKAALGQYLIHIEHYDYGRDRKVERYSVGVFE